jgi:Fic family protein
MVSARENRLLRHAMQDNIPHLEGNNLPMLFTAPDLEPAERAVVTRVEQLKKELSYSLPPQRWSGLLRRNTLARAVRGSNSIEGYTVTVDDAVAVLEGEEPLDATSEAWMAVAGYRLAMTFVLQKADDPYFTYSADLLQSLHYMMLSHDLIKNPGRWRPGPIAVRDDSTGERVYEGPPANAVPGLMHELVLSLNRPEADTPDLVQAAMAHFNLVMIHPFSDGNGRMARCLQTLVLARAGTLAPPFNSIEEYLGRNTREYYAVLAEVGGGAWQPRRDVRLWIRFCLTAHFRQAMTLLRRSRQLQRIWDALELEVKRRGLPERALLALADAAVGLRVRNATYRAAAELSEPAAGRDLKALVEAGLLEAQGEKRGRFYVASPLVRAIREQAAEPKVMPDPFAEAGLAEPVLPGLESYVADKS